MYKAFIPIFISSLCVFAGCTHNGMPTDKAMIAHFTENEVAFVKLQHLIGENLPGEHYPAFDPDSSRLSTISAEKKALLDSLLQAVRVGCFTQEQTANRNLCKIQSTLNE